MSRLIGGTATTASSYTAQSYLSSDPFSTPHKGGVPAFRSSSAGSGHATTATTSNSISSSSSSSMMMMNQSISTTSGILLTRKSPLKSSSFHIQRSPINGFIDAPPIIPDRTGDLPTYNTAPQHLQQQQQQQHSNFVTPSPHKRSTHFRAAEDGKSQVLPLNNSNNNETLINSSANSNSHSESNSSSGVNRLRTLSSSSVQNNNHNSIWHPSNGGSSSTSSSIVTGVTSRITSKMHPPLEQVKAISQSLRSRRSSRALPMTEEDISCQDRNSNGSSVGGIGSGGSGGGGGMAITIRNGASSSMQLPRHGAWSEDIDSSTSPNNSNSNNIGNNGNINNNNGNINSHIINSSNNNNSNMNNMNNSNSSSISNGDTGSESRFHGNGRHNNHYYHKFRYGSRLGSAGGGTLGDYFWRDAAWFKVFLSALHPGRCAIACFVFGLLFLVGDSYSRAVRTSESFQQLRDREAMLLLHLHQMEQQSIHLHEKLARLHERGGPMQLQQQQQQLVPKPAIQKAALWPGMEQHNNRDVLASEQDGLSIDQDLLYKQTQKLKEMEEELSHEVRALQGKIQRSCRHSIVSTYGEGAVQVILGLDFGGGGSPQQAGVDPELAPEAGDSGGGNGNGNAGLLHSNQIAILLWYDTPHAAWTWLEQIQRGVWNGATFDLDRGRSINARVTNTKAGETSRLDFVEQSQKSHEPWTVGLTDNGKGGLDLFINLHDNTSIHKHDVCVGKVIDGFDALQKLVDVTRQQSSVDPEDTVAAAAANRPVTIKLATASHLTRAQTNGLL